MYCTRVLTFLAVLLELAHSFSWDIVVAGEKRLQFFYNGTVTYTEDIPLAHSISSVTYDPVHYRLLFADDHSEKLPIYSFDLTTRKTQTLVMKQTSENLSYKHLAYDPVTQLLFWTECKKIYSLLLKPASSNVVVDGNLIATADDYVRDIDVDSCGGYIYWVTKNNIERAAFDGSEREVLINEYVYGRWSLVIDQQTKTMYWIDETTAYNHCIKSADLKGENRQTFYLIGPEPFAAALTISKDFIYWMSYKRDAILQLPKHKQHGVAPVVYTQSRNCGVCQRTAANYTIEEQTLANELCEALKTLIPDVEERHGSVCHNYCFQGNCTVSAEGHPKCSCEAGYSGERCEANPCHMYCLNNGVCSVNEAEKPVCQCTADYKGERCDVSICKDYCLQGNCSVSTEEGLPTCRCTAGYTGERCEVNACHEHCLNNGDCSLNEEDEPFCQCTADYEDIVEGKWQRLQFFYNGAATYTENIPFASEIYFVTYDPVHYRLLFVDHHNTWSIHSFDLTTKVMKTLVTRPTSPVYNSLAYDPVTELLFWSEDKNIYSLLLKPASSNVAVDGNIIATTDDYFGDIDVDSCGGYIYWVTKNNIERAAFDGSEREVLINDHIYWRQSLAIDQQTKTMYWIEDTTINRHSIESADLSGKNRRTFYFIGVETYASSLTVSKDFIYWRSYDQSAILQLPKKHQQHYVAPVVYTQSTRDYGWCQLTAANYTTEKQTLGNESCEALPDVEEHHCSVCHNYCFQGNCTVSAEGHPECRCNAGYSGERCEVNACHEHCLNNGDCSLNEEDEPICQCTADYEGERCEVSVCQNNCLSAEGQPNSRCNASYSGNRCEQNSCREFCLNNGVCSLHEGDEPVCRCSADYGGDRCELPAVLIKCIKTV